MFSENSRYFRAGTLRVKGPNGESVTITRIPSLRKDPLAGYHRRLEGQRLDVIASHFLKDATAFWRLCDANGWVVPDTLAIQALIGIPEQGG